MDVRLARPTDAPLVLALALDEGSQLVKGTDRPAAETAVRTLLRATFPLAPSGRTWLAREGTSVALLEARPHRYVIGWEISRLVARGDQEAVLTPAVQAAMSHLQSKGIPRLFALCAGEASEELKGLGFDALAREFVLTGPLRPIEGESDLPADSRYRMPQDAWPLHQLESETTPALVRQLEGLTSMEWSQSKRDMSEIVVERDGRVVAWIGWGAKAGRRRNRLGMMVHPRYEELGPQLLRHVLARAPEGHQYIARVREYQVEALQALTDAGFQIVAEDVLMVKHARIEYARAEKGRVRVARVPSIQAFPVRLHVIATDPRRPNRPNSLYKEDQP